MEYKRVQYDITKEDILAGKYDDNTMKLIDPLWWKIDIYNGLKKYKDTSAEFTDAQIAVFAVIWLDCEVGNGGYEQFLSNSTGIVWKDALDGLKLIGADKCAETLQNVIEKCGGSIPFDRGERREMLDRILTDPDDEEMYIDLFGEDDDMYYDYNLEIDELIIKYAKDNPEEFVYKGEVDVPEDYE